MACRKSRPASKLSQEIGVLAGQIGDAIKSAAHSKEVKGLHTEVSASVRSISKRVTKAVKKAQQSEKLDAIKGQTRKVLSLGKEEGLKATEQLRQNLTAGIDAAAKELRRLAEKLKKG